MSKLARLTKAKAGCLLVSIVQNHRSAILFLLKYCIEVFHHLAITSKYRWRRYKRSYKFQLRVSTIYLNWVADNMFCKRRNLEIKHSSNRIHFSILIRVVCSQLLLNTVQSLITGTNLWTEVSMLHLINSIF